MSTMQSPIGQVIRAVDGRMATPFDNRAFDLVKAQASSDAGTMEVKGTGYVFGTVGYFPLPHPPAMRVESGAIAYAPKNKKYRDVIGLYTHNLASVLARVGNNTMDLTISENQIDYVMRLNPADPEAQSVWAKLQREDVNASSIAFSIVDGDWIKAIDNSLDAERPGEEIDVFSVTEARLLEISLVAQGAFSGATSTPGYRDMSDEIVDGEVSKPFDRAFPVPIEQLKAEADLAQTDSVVESEYDNSESVQGESADESQSDPVDQSGGDGEDSGGSTESNDERGAEVAGDADFDSAEVQAERQGLTVKELLAETPHSVRRRVTNG